MMTTKEEVAEIKSIFDKDVEEVTDAELEKIIAHMREVRAKFLAEEFKPKRKSKREQGDMLAVKATDVKRKN